MTDNNSKKSGHHKTPIQALSAAALVLPGLLPIAAHAAEDDSVDFQYSHYQEGKRTALNPYVSNSYFSSSRGHVPIPNNYNPIEVDSLHGSARVSLTDRIKFSFNYLQDTWSGATPMADAPENSGTISYGTSINDDNGRPVIGGASPLLGTLQTLTINRQGRPVYEFIDPKTNTTQYLPDRVVHIMSYASPETRQQGDFKLSYQWDEAAMDLGGGISIENDYESRFVNLGGRLDFNQKQTTLDIGLSYTNSDIHARPNPFGNPFWIWTGRHLGNINFSTETGYFNISGTRQDWSTHLGLTQIINTASVMKLGMSYTRSTGFLENPYKLATVYNTDTAASIAEGITRYGGQTFLEQRPDERNLWQWSAGWVQYIKPLDAALHFDYSFAHDDWGINAHTFEADWVQPLGTGWTMTPRIRYYSQSAADFYGAYFFGGGQANLTNPDPNDPNQKTFNPPENFSSDQRLSGYGTLSGGLTVEKKFAKGVSLETGFEYYTHQGSLKLGGGGEDSFADFDYWVANAALKVNLSAMGQSLASNSHGGHAHEHPDIPAGLWFGHTLSKAGDMMVGYRYQRSWQAGSFLHGDGKVSQDQVIATACPTQAEGCSMLQREMSMNMHMLDIMYAPTDWLTLMLMPQFMNMEMPSYHPNVGPSIGSHVHGGGAREHTMQTGGVGDTGMYALINLFDQPHHHLHLGIGFSAPTGAVDLRNTGNKNLASSYVHYGMQLGSGTWDFKPSLTYTGKAGDISWGAQVAGTKRLETRNASGYALGDMFESSLWGGYDLNNWLSGTVRVTYSWQGAIQGRFRKYQSNEDIRLTYCSKAYYTSVLYDSLGNTVGPGIFDEPGYQACLNGESYKNEIKASNLPIEESPADVPGNYGGHYVDVGFGLSATVPTGAFAGNRLAFEWLQPVYTNVNGYQLDRDGALSATWSYGF